MPPQSVIARTVRKEGMQAIVLQFDAYCGLVGEWCRRAVSLKMTRTNAAVWTVWLTLFLTAIYIKANYIEQNWDIVLAKM